MKKKTIIKIMKNISKNTFTINSALRIVFILACFGLIVWYSLFQARYLIEGPRITLIDEPSAINNEQIITIAGTTENITRLSLNGREIYTNRAGVFNESLVLENGYTIMTLKAKDRYGRTTSLSKSFVYQTDTIN